MANSSLGKARDVKNDEFYTQLKDIENELVHYADKFKGKVILCNCDDPKQSQFWKYFRTKFNHLGLKKLISTHYKDSMLWDKEAVAYVKTYDGEKERRRNLEGSGGFETAECIELLKECDIVCTNPPFSLFSDFVDLIIRHKKKFLIIGNMNAVTYKDFFELIKENKVWFGMTPKSGGMEFQVTDEFKGKVSKTEKGKRFTKLGFACWFTNLPNKRLEEEIPAVETYNKKEYPHYDNYDAVEVGYGYKRKTERIPKGYKGKMGVPISYLTRHNPKQFEIIGLCWILLLGQPGGVLTINGERVYRRIIIKWKDLPK